MKQALLSSDNASYFLYMLAIVLNVFVYSETNDVFVFYTVAIMAAIGGYYNDKMSRALRQSYNREQHLLDMLETYEKSH